MVEICVCASLIYLFPLSHLPPSQSYSCHSELLIFGALSFSHTTFKKKWLIRLGFPSALGKKWSEERAGLCMSILAPFFGVTLKSYR